MTTRYFVIEGEISDFVNPQQDPAMVVQFKMTLRMTLSAQASGKSLALDFNPYGLAG